MNVLLREAIDNDLDLMFLWRNDPEIYQSFYTQDKKLTWDEHISWWKSRNKDWRTFVIIHNLRPVGIVTIGQLDHWCPELGYYIDRLFWDKGIGKEAVKKGLEYIKKYGREYAHTTILDINERSIRLVKSLGFKYLGTAREGESWYQKKL